MQANPVFLGRLSALALAALSVSALAQGVYRQVGPDGRVTYTDQPPTAVAPPAVPAAGGGAGATLTELPLALRQAVSRYPVTLYTSQDCNPCDQGRQLLVARGVPFTEKTISTQADAQAFQRVAGGSGVPYLTLGAQAVVGFSREEWTQYLDVAGYPKQSVLPRTYRAQAPSPLAPVTQSEAAPATAADTSRPTTPPPTVVAPSGPTPQNPAGIRF